MKCEPNRSKERKGRQTLPTCRKDGEHTDQSDAKIFQKGAEKYRTRGCVCDATLGKKGVWGETR